MPEDEPSFARVEVDCYAGYQGEETPRRFRFGERLREVVEVVDRWLAPDHRYFKVQDADGDLYILRHDVSSGLWEITLFRSRGTHDSSIVARGDGATH